MSIMWRSVWKTLPYEYIRWIENEDMDLNKLVGTSDMKKIKDLEGQSAAAVRQQLVCRHGA